MTHHRLAALSVALCLPWHAAAQTVADSAARITSITIERHNIFDVTDSTYWPLRLANHLHITTRAPFIRRELLFTEGEVFDSARVAETGRNLRAMGVFSSVAIDTIRTDSGVAVNVITRDGWSTRPDFRFHLTGGSLAYTAALIEENLLGTVTQTQVLYQKDPDRTSVVFAFNRKRLFASKVGTTLTYADQSDGQIFSGEVAIPYFALSSRNGDALDVATQDGRILQYRFGSIVPADTSQRRYALARLDLGHALVASPRGYVRAGFLAQVRRDDYAAESFAIDSGVPGHTVTGAFGGYVEARRAHFLTVRGFQSFGRNEDVDLSNVVRISLLAAPTALGYAQGGIAPGIGAHTGLRLPGGFAVADLTANGLFTAAGLDSGGVTLGATAVFLPSVRHQLVLHGEVGSLRHPIPGAEFDLGFGVGPRAFTQHAFTGDREEFVSAEYRYTVSREVLKLTGIGVAAFADQGGAWWSADARRTGWDLGAGLRLGPSRAPEVEAARIDLAYRMANDVRPGGWVLVIGKGFVFSASPRNGH